MTTLLRPSISTQQATTASFCNRNKSTNNIMASFESSGYPSSEPMSALTRDALQNQGFPKGLAEAMWENRQQCPIRFWVVDNSGSMKCPDGHIFKPDPKTKNNIFVTPSTRWAELQSTLVYHAELAGKLELRTTFTMLNDPGLPNMKDEFCIGDPNASLQQEMASAQAFIRMTEADGVTPLTRHVMAIHEKVVQIEDKLRQHGQKAVVVLATDGIPSDAHGNSTQEVKDEFMAALSTLHTLPVWLVIRLCTDDEGCADYYNSLDANLEVQMEVLDDLFAEAAQVGACNDWLNYALPLHRCREMGFRHQLFDLLDERKLNKDETVELLKLLFGKEQFEKAPDIHTEFKDFLALVKTIVKKEDKQWNPLTKQLERWVDVKKLEKAFKPEGRRSLMGKLKSLRGFQ